MNGQEVSFLVDRYRVWTHWWEGQPPRDYYLLDVSGKTVEIYQTYEGWFPVRTLD